MAAQPDEIDGSQIPAQAEPPAPPAAPRPAPTPSRPRSWLHRLRRASQLTPSDLDPDAILAGPRSDVTLARRSPFAIGFFITLGALTAFGLVFGLYRISSVVVLVMLALYIALGLNPLVDKLSSRGVRRGFAVFLVALSAIAVVALAFWAVLPVAYEQINRLLLNAPSLLQELRANSQIAALDTRYDIINRISTFLTSGELLSTMFGGLWGASQAVAGIVFSGMMTIVLTLYFLASMESVKHAILELAPASRRPRVRYLADEMFSRIGGYVTGLFIVVTCAATVAFIFLSIVGLGQYALALAVVVALCAVIPLIGSTVVDGDRHDRRLHLLGHPGLHHLGLLSLLPAGGQLLHPAAGVPALGECAGAAGDPGRGERRGAVRVAGCPAGHPVHGGVDAPLP